MNAHTAQSVDAPTYKAAIAAANAAAAAQENDIIAQAFHILSRRIQDGPVFNQPNVVREFLTLRAAQEADQHIERFAVLFVDAQNRYIDAETMFTGTLNQTSVYPREVVRKALAKNAAAVILTHNHPSGDARPSRADETLTQTLKSALALVDVRVLDHFITTPGGKCASMAEMGLV